MVLYSVYHLGAESVQKKWDAEKAEIAAQIEKNAADNNILKATLKGNYHASLIGIDSDFNLGNSVSASFGSFAERGSTGRTFNCAGSGGISEERARIATQRASVVDEIIGIAKERNLLAKHAKTNTVKLINLQDWEQGSK